MSEGQHGETFDAALDGKRLKKQGERVLDLMRDGAWRTLGEIASVTNDPEASVSARLRDLRKAKIVVERRRRRPCGGLWEYRVAMENSDGR